jgi:serine/threonine protein kinase
VLLCEGGARIADFGVASMLATPAAGLDDTLDAASPLTRTGTVVGTPTYMAPELTADARDPKLSSDLYSFGVVGYEILSGRRPFAHAMRDSTFAPLRDAAPGFSDEVAALIERALSLDPGARPTAADAVRVLAGT